MKSLFVVMALLLTGTAAQTKPPKVAWMPPFIAATESTAPTVPVGVDAIYVDSAHKWQCITNGGTPHECTDAEILHVLPKPEPMDVPAIHRPVKSELVPTVSCHDNICTDGIMACTNNGTMAPRKPGEWTAKCVDGYTWTCADKSRIMLTDEGGGKHCVKFPKEQP